jgi:hypothetical protein
MTVWVFSERGGTETRKNVKILLASPCCETICKRSGQLLEFGPEMDVGMYTPPIDLMRFLRVSVPPW